MNNHIDLPTVMERLKENRLSHAVLELQDGIRVVVTERGGRVLGPFLQDWGESIFWLPPDFTRADLFRTFLAENKWNLGGERIWISPEVQFNLKNRWDWGSYWLQPQMDPGERSLERVGSAAIRIRAEMRLQAFNLASGRKKLRIEQTIRLADNPLSGLRAYLQLMEGVRYAGYEQVVSLWDLEPTPIACEAWNLIQLNPGGTVLLPAPPFAEYTRYRGRVDNRLFEYRSGFFSHQLSGKDEYKLGYKAAHLTCGRMAYLNQLEDGQVYLLIRSFYNNPSCAYVEEPTDQPGVNGHVVHIYNDGGDFGGFGEMEVMGQTLGGTNGRTESVDPFVLWFFCGPPEKIVEIARHLLGVDISEKPGI